VHSGREMVKLFLDGDLATKGIATKTHKGLIQQFGKNFIQPKIISAEHGQTLTDLHDDRQSADYLAITDSFEYEEVHDNVQRAHKFVEEIARVIS